MNKYMSLTLAELMECPDETIRRNAMSIYKTVQKIKYEKIHPNIAWRIKKQ